MKFNERLKQAREFLKLSQDDFAHGVGMTQSGYSHLEKGKGNPNFATSEKIRYFIAKKGINPDWLFNEVGQMVLDADTVIEEIKAIKIKPETRGDMTIEVLLSQIEELRADKRFLQEQLSKH